MLVVLAFHSGDKAQAVSLANWIKEMGNVSEDKCLIALGSGCGETDVIEPLLECFGSVSVFRAENKVELRGEGLTAHWRAANAMWQSVAWKIHFQDKCQWLWLEPDAIPTRPTWLREIKEEYFTHGKPFMGFKSVKKSKVPGEPDAVWINGVAVYPAPVCDYAPLALQAGECAWDLNAGLQMVQHAHVSSLFQHVWLIDGQAPTFPKDKDKLNNAALFHQCKDGTLIAFLKEHGYTKSNLSGDQKAFATKAGAVVEETQSGRSRESHEASIVSAPAAPSPDESDEIGESVDYAQRLEEEQRRHPVRPQKPKEGERFGELIWRGGKWHTATDVVEAPKADRKAVMEKYKHPEKDFPVPALADPPTLDETSGEARESDARPATLTADSRGGENDLLQSKGEGDIASIAHQGHPEAKKEPEEPGSPSPDNLSVGVEESELQDKSQLETTPPAQTRHDLIEEAVAVLKLLCTSPHAISKVRKELKKQKVTK